MHECEIKPRNTSVLGALTNVSALAVTATQNERLYVNHGTITGNIIGTICMQNDRWLLYINRTKTLTIPFLMVVSEVVCMLSWKMIRNGCSRGEIR